MASTIKLTNENGKVTTISSGSSTTDITVDASTIVTTTNTPNIQAQTDTIATLKAMVETPSTIYVTGYTAANDGAFGSHFFKWNSASVATDNGGTVIKLDGIVTGRYELQYDGAVNVKWFGADESEPDNHGSFDNAIGSSNSIMLGKGDFKVVGQLGEYTQIPVNVKGTSPDSVIYIQDSVAATCFKLGAIGGDIDGVPNYRERVKSSFSDLVFMPDATKDYKIEYYNFTAIDLNIVLPINLKDNTYLDLGHSALHIKNSFYGYTLGQVFVNSGLKLYEVNTLEFSGFESRPSNITLDPTGGAYQFSNINKYPIDMELSDLVKFSGAVIEGWKVPVALLSRCDTTVFNDTWFEGLTGSNLITMNQSQGLNFVNCQIDCAIPYTGSFIHVNNLVPTTDIRQSMITTIAINNGNILLESVGFGKAPKFISVANASNVIATLDGVDFRGGELYADRGVKLSIKNMLLSSTVSYSYVDAAVTYYSDFGKFLYSEPNANIKNNYNSWVPNSKNADYDFVAGAALLEIGTTGLTIATTSVTDEVMTGTRSAKISGIPTGSTKIVGRNTHPTGELVPITSRDESYIFFARVKCDQDVDIQLLYDGGFSDVKPSTNAVVPARAGEWVDIVFKPSREVSWAQTRTYAPNIKLSITNNSGSTATLYVDRLDYANITTDCMLIG